MKDSFIFISGASSDIGQNLIKRLASSHTNILAHYHTSADAILSLGKNICANIIPLQADFSSEKEISLLWEKIQCYCECPNAFVHLAAPKVLQIRFKDLQWDEIQKNFDIQYKAAYLLLSKMLPQMAKRKSGKVVLMLSSYTLNVPPSAMTHYVSVKYALLGLMKSLSAEYRAKNININAISPSMVQTKFLTHIPRVAIEMTSQQHPLKRNAIPDDICPIIQFLISPESDFICGVNLPVTGGETF
ncbi:MAG: SDR family oxidoreductase [Oligoflexia bacterium]|nr:SDR family oxidoreductase [Oligoflexia bacterium]